MQREIVERQHQLNLKQIEDQKLAREDRADTIRLQRLIKRMNMEDALYDAQVKQQEEIAAREAKQYTDFFKTYEMGVARAVAASLFFGDSFKETVAKVLQSLAIEAGARALFQGAAALASYAIGDAKGATEHLASAAIYASAAAAAATGATLLGAGASSGTGGATASPTGAPQVAATPQRDEAESREMTFNLNFGGAVIYDTKEAAKRAMIGDLVRTYNGNNRGMPRFNFAR